MPPGIKMRVEIKFDPAAKGRIRSALSRGLDDAMTFDVVPLAKELSPKRTGTNARSIDHEVELRGDEIRADLFTQTGYGGYLEVGTSRMSARPYLRPAVERSRAAILRALEKAMP